MLRHTRQRRGPQTTATMKTKHVAPPPALVVEYDAWLRSAVAALLEEIGWAVATASNGSTGLRVALALRPRLIVIGGTLPELTPEAMLRELRPRLGATGLQVFSTDALLSGTAPASPSRRIVARSGAGRLRSRGLSEASTQTASRSRQAWPHTMPRVIQPRVCRAG